MLSDADYSRRIEEYSTHLKKLLQFEPVLYSDWSHNYADQLKAAAGVYHFYQEEGDSNTSLYVGKAGFGSGNWSLYDRLKQHFQPSQKNALIGKMAKATGDTPDQIKEYLTTNSIYLQWVIVSRKSEQMHRDIEATLNWVECFCKAMLKPKYTDA